MIDITHSWKDWRYTDDRLALRSQCILRLLKEYGGVKIDTAPYKTRDLFECAHDWISQGNQSVDGIVNYFKVTRLNEIKESS
jgi:hypothetical protein